MPKFPFYQQLDAMDCGPTCLRIVAKFYGKSYSLQKLRKLSYISRRGVSMLGISDAAENIGFRTKGVRLTVEQIAEEAPLPAIIHWKQNHFVVLYDVKRKRKGNKYYISDPAHGLLCYDESDFKKFWISTKCDNESQGTALLIETTPEFYNIEDKDQSKLSPGYLLGYLRPYRKFIIQLFLSMIVGSVLSLIFPFLTQSIVDYGIGNSDLSFIFMILIAQMFLSFGQMANGLIRSWLMLHITTRLSISLISDFLSKLMRLPISFFDIKMIGDIMQRIGDHERIQSFLTGSLINILFAAISLVVYSGVMASYHLGILGIFFAGSILYVLWVLLFLKKRRELDYKRFQHSSDNQSNVVQLITGMQEIKLNACEKQKRWEWERIQAGLFKISVKGLTLSQNQQVGAAFINQAKNITISFLSAKAVVEGNMTLGMMMAVQYIIGQLNGPIQQFIGFIQSYQDAKISLERLGEIHDKEDEESPESIGIVDIPNSGDIVVKDLSFSYDGPHSEKVLKNINLVVPKNKVTAIVGTSGSGKTTLMKLILGFYNVEDGDILLDNRKIDNYSQREWRKSCGVVMQEGFLFSDSIANNISVIDEFPDTDKIAKSVKTACIDEYIESIPLRYNTKIGSDGTGLSTGQKQRLLIARAVYKDPQYLFFDEATNALDAKNEKKIMENLDKFFKDRTVLIIAHRLSTVKKADQIVVLEQGKITETGTHTELIANKGGYFNLVKDQLELGT